MFAILPLSKFDFCGSCGRLIVSIFGFFFRLLLALSLEIYAIAACIGI